MQVLQERSANMEGQQAHYCSEIFFLDRLFLEHKATVLGAMKLLERKGGLTGVGTKSASS